MDLNFRVHKVAKLVRAGGRHVAAFHGERDPLIRQIRAQRLTFLEANALRDLQELAVCVERAQMTGSIIEAGCALGGSAILLARSKAISRPLYVYDVFGMIPAPSDADGDDVQDRYADIVGGKARGIGPSDLYYGYESDLIRKVSSNFRRFAVDIENHNVILVKGRFQETLFPEGPVCLVHIDADWYESVKVCLERIWPALVPGGVIVIDDYDSWSGCHRAVDEFLSTATDCEMRRRSRLQLVKLKR